MNRLRAKMTWMRTAMIAFGFMVLMLLTMQLILSGEAALMTTGWTGFRKSMTDFFYTGLGGDGAAGIGIVIAVVGIILAAVSFVMHKLNPQTRMPGWFTCLVIAVIGSLLFTGVQPVLSVITWLRDTVMGWFGFSGFGNFS